MRIIKLREFTWRDSYISLIWRRFSYPFLTISRFRNAPTYPRSMQLPLEPGPGRRRRQLDEVLLLVVELYQFLLVLLGGDHRHLVGRHVSVVFGVRHRVPRLLGDLLELLGRRLDPPGLVGRGEGVGHGQGHGFCELPLGAEEGVALCRVVGVGGHEGEDLAVRCVGGTVGDPAEDDGGEHEPKETASICVTEGTAYNPFNYSTSLILLFFLLLLSIIQTLLPLLLKFLVSFIIIRLILTLSYDTISMFTSNFFLPNLPCN